MTSSGSDGSLAVGSSGSLSMYAVSGSNAGEIWDGIAGVIEAGVADNNSAIGEDVYWAVASSASSNETVE